MNDESDGNGIADCCDYNDYDYYCNEVGGDGIGCIEIDDAHHDNCCNVIEVDNHCSIVLLMFYQCFIIVY